MSVRQCIITPSGGGYSVRIRAESASFYLMVDSLKSHFAGRCRFSDAERCWVITASLADIQRWASQHFLPSEIHLDSPRSWSQDRPQRTTGVDAAYRTLHLLPTAPAWAVDAVHRAAVKTFHPDRGGDTALMAQVNAAVDVIRAVQR